MAVFATGCFKVASDSAVSKDGSATVKLTMSYDTETLDKIKAQMDAAIEMMGEDNPEIAEAKAAVDKIGEAFDPKKAGDEWKKLGIDVSKSSAIEKDGWKGFEMEGTIKNLADYNRKHAEAAESRKSGKGADSPMGGDPSAFAVPRMPRFFKTDQPNVAKVVLAWREPSQRDDQLEMIENMSDEEREQVEAVFDMQRAEMNLDNLRVEMRVKLPGKVLSVSNAKQEGEDVVIFQFLGSNLTLDNMPKMRDIPSATMQFDPKEFKIPLEDEPKAESKPAKKAEEKPKKDEEEKKKDEDEDK
jgi:hypothetical protein